MLLQNQMVIEVEQLLCMKSELHAGHVDEKKILYSITQHLPPNALGCFLEVLCT